MDTDELQNLRSQLAQAEAELENERQRRAAAEVMAQAARATVDEAALLVERLADKTAGPSSKKSRLLSVVLTVVVTLSFVAFLGVLYWVTQQSKALRDTQRRSLHSLGDTEFKQGPAQIVPPPQQRKGPVCAPCPPCAPSAAPPGGKAPAPTGVP